jgi:hypothetical protein
MAKSNAPSKANESRRSFLKRSAALVSGAALSGCASPSPEPGTGVGAGADVDALTAIPSGSGPALTDDYGVLEALARAVLPRDALGDDGVLRIVNSFRDWLSRFQANAELDHPYLYTDEILYGPPHPAPVWGAQLEALELEATERHGSPFRDLDVEQQSELVADQLPGDLEGSIRDAGSSPHIALGLLAYFYSTSEANDLGYEAAIEKQTCRGLESAPQKPVTSTSTSTSASRS